MPHELLIATNNAIKLEEFQEIFAPLQIAITYPAAAGLQLDPAETGLTFEQNAVIKALAFARITALPVLADDSGLEVDALDGEPGIYSARYGQTAKDDYVGRYRLLLAKLAAKNVPWDQRTARFRCVIALARQGQLLTTVEGRVEGFIAYAPKGSNGFGYDPVFFIPELNQTLAELPSDQKHRISHRGRAVQAAIPLIEQMIQKS